MDQIQMYQTVTQICMTFETHRLETNVSQIMMTDQLIMKAQRAKSSGKNNAKIAKSLFPIRDTGKLKAISACSNLISRTPLMRPTQWLGPSMTRLLGGSRKEQFCNNH